MYEINAAKYNIFIHLHLLEAWQQNTVDLQGCGDVHGGGVGVVTALQQPDFSLHLQIFFVT